MEGDGWMDGWMYYNTARLFNDLQLMNAFINDIYMHMPAQ